MESGDRLLCPADNSLFVWDAITCPGMPGPRERAARTLPNYCVGRLGPETFASQTTEIAPIDENPDRAHSFEEHPFADIHNIVVATNSVVK